jgi:P27 family predicted phage terminase small subunit
VARGRKPSPGGLADKGGGCSIDPPSDLSPAALEKWRVIVPLIAERVSLEATDLDALCQYCDAAVLRAKAVLELADERLTLMSPNGARQVNPLLKVISQAESVLMKLSERFGLDPASRKRLQIAAKKSASPFLDYLNRGKKLPKSEK